MIELLQTDTRLKILLLKPMSVLHVYKKIQVPEVILLSNAFDHSLFLHLLQQSPHLRLPIKT